MLSVDELIREIAGKTGKSDEEIKKMISEKQVELSNLVSEEGAAYIVGRELGVELIKETKRVLKIASIVPDMRNVDVVARVASVFDVREFEKNGKTGKVTSIMLADDTGTIRLPFWNDEVNFMSSLGIKQNDVIEVSGVWAKKDNYKDGGVELRMGKRGKIKIIEEGEVPEVSHSDIQGSGNKPAKQASVRLEVSALQQGMNVIIKGTLVQVYRKRPFYDSCPQCGGRVEENQGSISCKEHGSVTPMPNALLTGVVDDGTGNVRVVLFRDQAEKILGTPAEQAKNDFNSAGMDAFWDKFRGLGVELMIDGRVKTNDLSKELEIVANSVQEVNVKEEAGKLLEELSN